jgi:hypothetical protein
MRPDRNHQGSATFKVEKVVTRDVEKRFGKGVRQFESYDCILKTLCSEMDSIGTDSFSFFQNW